MWLYLVAAIIIVIALIGGLLAGGIFTIVFIPVAVVIAAAVGALYVFGRSSRRPTLPAERGDIAPLPHTDHANVAPTPSTPDDLVDARRQAQ